jgi:hypothetical protein
MKRVEVGQYRHRTSAVVDDWKRSGALVDHPVDGVRERRRLVDRRYSPRELTRTNRFDCERGIRRVDQTHEAPVVVYDDGDDGPFLLQCAREGDRLQLGVNRDSNVSHCIADADVATEPRVREQVTRPAFGLGRRAFDRAFYRAQESRAAPTSIHFDRAALSGAKDGRGCTAVAVVADVSKRADAQAHERHLLAPQGGWERLHGW